MNKPLYKICGINNQKILDYLISSESNANFLGFIFYENSPRNVNDDFLRTINKTDFKDKKPVCVYVNASEEFVRKTSSYFKNPLLQFHGDETNTFCKLFKKEFWKVIRFKDVNCLDKIHMYPDASGILLENYQKGVHGGTGKSFNWQLIPKKVLKEHKIILSGGINSKNVDNAIGIDPWCIDINSGVESTKGVKEIKLIKEIFKNF